MGHVCLLLGCAILLSLPGTHALSSSEQTLQKVFADLIIRLKKWIHENEAELKEGMSAIRKHLSTWGIGLGPAGHGGRWRPEKTSNNIRPKPIYKPGTTGPPRPMYPKPPAERPQIPRWNRKAPRLSKSPYDPAYFRRHRRLRRSLVPARGPQRDRLVAQCLEILAQFADLARAADRALPRSARRTERLLDEKKRELEHMSTEELKSLLKKLHDTRGDVIVNPQSGDVTINGNRVDIDKICCPFG